MTGKCSQTKVCFWHSIGSTDFCENCVNFEPLSAKCDPCKPTFPECEKCEYSQAESVEELQGDCDRIADHSKTISNFADISKMVDELIEKHQAEVDNLALSEKAKYGDNSTVSTYTWMHSLKSAHQKFIRDLLDIQHKMEEENHE